jgi:Leucine-rich repeat (LRR) protein
VTAAAACADDPDEHHIASCLAIASSKAELLQNEVAALPNVSSLLPSLSELRDAIARANNAAVQGQDSSLPPLLRYVQHRAGPAASAASVTSLDLSRLGLTSLRARTVGTDGSAGTSLLLADMLPRLRSLVLSGNQLKSLDGLGTMPALIELKADANPICRLHGLVAVPLPSLERLDLSHTLLDSAALAGASEHLRASAPLAPMDAFPVLTALNVRATPLSRHPGYRFASGAVIPSLRELDGLPVPPYPLSHRAANFALYGGGSTFTRDLRTSLISESALRQAALSLLPATVTAPPILTRAARAARFAAEDSTPPPTSLVEAVFTAGSAVAPPLIAACPSLTVLRLGYTPTLTLSGIEHCTALQELYAPYTFIDAASLRSVASCRELRVLDITGTRVADLASLGPLSALQTLAAGFTPVSSANLPPLPALSELYIPATRIADPDELPALAVHPRLVVLELAGSPITANPCYRPTIVFRLPRVRVLDGVPVSPAEARAAKSRFLGRVTAETVTELGGEHALRTLTVLALPGRGLKDVTGLAIATRLGALDLTANTITSLSALPSLPQLQELNLSRNRVQSPGSAAHLPALVRLTLAENPLDPQTCTLSTAASLLYLDLSSCSLPRTPDALLSACPRLRQLILRGNRIRLASTSAFAHLRDLEMLDLNGNCLRAFDAFSRPAGQAGNSEPPFQRLRSLDVGANRVSELVEMSKLSLLPALETLIAEGNSVARKGTYRQHTVLACARLGVLDGVPVSAEEREEAAAMLGVGAGGIDPRSARVPLAVSALHLTPNMTAAEGLGSGLPAGVGAAGLGGPTVLYAKSRRHRSGPAFR